MGLRFRKSVKILPGVKLNLSKSRTSMTVGKRGMSVNFSSRGTRTAVGIPGTGVSYTIYSRKSRIPKVKSPKDYKALSSVDKAPYMYKASYSDTRKKNANTAMRGCASLIFGIFLFLGFLIIGHNIVGALGSLGMFGLIYYLCIKGVARKKSIRY